MINLLTKQIKEKMENTIKNTKWFRNLRFAAEYIESKIEDFKADWFKAGEEFRKFSYDNPHTDYWKIATRTRDKQMLDYSITEKDGIVLFLEFEPNIEEKKVKITLRAVDKPENSIFDKKALGDTIYSATKTIRF